MTDDASRAHDEAGAYGEAHQAGDIVDVESIHQLSAVGFDGLDAQLELSSDVLRRAAFGDELEHLAMAGCEPTQRIGLDLARRASPIVGHEVLRDRRTQIRLAARHGQDAELQLSEVGIFEQVAGGACLERRERVLLAGVHGQDDHGGGGVLLDDATGRLEPVQPGHGDVHEDEPWPQLVDQLDDLVTVLGLADHFDAGDAGEERADAGADERMVVGQHDADRCHRVVLIEPAGRTAAGSQARTMVPGPPEADSILDRPPARSTRSSSPRMPMLSPARARRRAAATSNPAPSSRTEIASVLSTHSSVTEIRVARAGRTTFVTASWTTRKQVGAMAGGK